MGMQKHTSSSMSNATAEHWQFLRCHPSLPALLPCWVGCVHPNPPPLRFASKRPWLLSGRSSPRLRLMWDLSPCLSGSERGKSTRKPDGSAREDNPPRTGPWTYGRTASQPRVGREEAVRGWKAMMRGRGAEEAERGWRSVLERRRWSRWLKAFQKDELCEAYLDTLYKYGVFLMRLLGWTAQIVFLCNLAWSSVLFFCLCMLIRGRCLIDSADPDTD